MVQPLAAVVQPPPVPTPRWPGLLASIGGEAAARGVDERWAAGFRFVPPMCGFNEELPLIACQGGAFNVSAADPGAADAIPVDALYHWSAVQRSTFCATEDEMVVAAKDRLGRDLSHKLEKELWTGASYRSLSADGQYFTDGDATLIASGSATPLVYGLARLQKTWGSCARGARGMIHCPPDLATLWYSAGVIRREGNLVLDLFDNIVVVGTGYDGSGESHTPDSTGETAYAFMTGIVGALLGTVDVISTTDPTNNVDLALAHRPGATFFDPCCVVGVNVDMCSPCCTPA